MRHEEHTMPSKADIAIARTIGIDTDMNTLHLIAWMRKGDRFT